MAIAVAPSFLIITLRTAEFQHFISFSCTPAVRYVVCVQFFTRSRWKEAPSLPLHSRRVNHRRMIGKKKPQKTLSLPPDNSDNWRAGDVKDSLCVQWCAMNYLQLIANLRQISFDASEVYAKIWLDESFRGRDGFVSPCRIKQSSCFLTPEQTIRD